MHRNPFASLYNEPECYFCHNFGHKASECRLKLYKPKSKKPQTSGNVKLWKKKEDNKCGLVFLAQKQKIFMVY